MPAKLDRCVQDLMKQGKSRDEAFAICQASLNKEEESPPVKGKKEKLPFAKGNKEAPKKTPVPKKKAVVPKRKK